MSVLRLAAPCCVAILFLFGAARSSSAAILYQFTTADSSTAPADDGYVATDVTITAAPSVIGPVDGTALALGSTSTSPSLVKL